MEWWQAVILGLVEGITEYLPVSSTGHLIIAAGLMGLTDDGVKSSVDAFAIVIQGGAILAVLGLYRARVVQMLRGLLGRDAAGRRLLINLIVAFVPAAVLGLLLDDLIEKHLFYPLPVVAALLLGGFYMILIDLWRAGYFGPARDPQRERDLDELRARGALAIGMLQCLAMWPGMSRSMMTITGGVLMGLRPRQAAEFSFLLGLPTLGAATMYRLVKNVSHAAENGTDNLFDALGWPAVLIGLVVATISAGAAVKWLVAFLNRHGLALFGVYRIVLSLLLLSLVTAGLVRVGPAEASEAGAGVPPASQATPAPPPGDGAP